MAGCACISQAEQTGSLKFGPVGAEERSGMPPRFGAGQKKGLLGPGLQGGFGKEIRGVFASWSLRGPGETSAAQHRQQGVHPHLMSIPSRALGRKVVPGGILGVRAVQWALGSREQSLTDGQDLSAATWILGHLPPEVVGEVVLVSDKLLDPVRKCRFVWKTAGGRRPGALLGPRPPARSAQPQVPRSWRSGFRLVCPRRPH